VVDVDETALQKSGYSLFRTGGASLAKGQGGLRQGFVEDSAVDEVRALLDMTNSSREVEFNADLMRTHDRLSDRAIGSLVRPIL
jgi:flagellar basal body rod protein FlgG